MGVADSPGFLLTQKQPVKRSQNDVRLLAGQGLQDIQTTETGPKYFLMFRNGSQTAIVMGLKLLLQNDLCVTVASGWLVPAEDLFL